MKNIFTFIRNEDGATAVEYAIMLVSIAAVIIATVAALGQQVLGLFQPLVGAF